MRSGTALEKPLAIHLESVRSIRKVFCFATTKVQVASRLTAVEDDDVTEPYDTVIASSDENCQNHTISSERGWMITVARRSPI